MAKAKPIDPNSKDRNRVLLALVISCGVFTFVYWFIFFPLVWEFLSVNHVERFWFNVICLGLFACWILIILLGVLIWYLYNLGPAERVRRVNNEHDARFDGPSYPVVPSKVQPETDVEMSSLCLKPPSSIETVVAIPVQPQNTPSLYNLHTGRRSYEIESEKPPEQPSKKQIKYKSISSTDSEPSLNDWGIMFSNKDVHNVQVRTKRETLPSSQHAVVTSVVVEPEKRSPVNERQQQQGDLFRFPDRATLFEENPDGEIIHETEPLSPDNFTPNADKLSQNLPIFNSYLHLTDIEPPLSPREVFFSDLIKQADQNDAKRRSYCVSDSTAFKPDVNKRKSVPLFLCTSQVVEEQANEVEQSVDSDLEVFEDASQKTPFESNEIICSKPERTPSKVVSFVPVINLDDDLREVTSMFIDEERKHSCIPPLPAIPVDAEVIERDVEEIDENYIKVDVTKPLKLSLDEEPTPVSPGRNKLDSQSEYFIANISKPKTVTSEAFLVVDDSCPKISGTISKVEVIVPTQKQEYSISTDQMEFDPADDCVFDDVQASLSKLKHKHK